MNDNKGPLLASYMGLDEAQVVIRCVALLAVLQANCCSFSQGRFYSVITYNKAFLPEKE